MTPVRDEPLSQGTSRVRGFQVGRSAPSFYEAHVWRLMTPFVELLVERTVAPGRSVLDVACGTGFATRAAALVAGRGHGSTALI